MFIFTWIEQICARFGAWLQTLAPVMPDDYDPPAYRPRDKYDEAISILSQLYEQDDPEYFRSIVLQAWRAANVSLEKLIDDQVSMEIQDTRCLFKSVCPGEAGVGCLTQIRAGHGVGHPDREITNEIIADLRLPCSPSRILPEDLPAFAEWQRKLDRINAERSATDWALLAGVQELLGRPSMLHSL